VSGQEKKEPLDLVDSCEHQLGQSRPSSERRERVDSSLLHGWGCESQMLEFQPFQRGKLLVKILLKRTYIHAEIQERRRGIFNHSAAKQNASVQVSRAFYSVEQNAPLPVSGAFYMSCGQYYVDLIVEYESLVYLQKTIALRKQVEVVAAEECSADSEGRILFLWRID